MGIIVRERAAHEAALMDHTLEGTEMIFWGDMQQQQPESQLPCGWEKCLDLKTGLVYFKDWSSGSLSYKDPRQSVTLALATKHDSLLPISLCSSEKNTTVFKSSRNSSDDGTSLKKLKREPSTLSDDHRVGSSTVRLLWGFPSAQHSSANEGDSTSESIRKTSNSMSMDDDQSLELTLNLPGTVRSKPRPSSNQIESVCTIDKVRSALDRFQCLNTVSPQLSKKRSFEQILEPGLNLNTSDLKTQPALSSSRVSTSTGQLQSDSYSKTSTSSQTTSQWSACSESRFTSPSVMSYQGDDEEVQQPSACRASGAKSSQLNLLDGKPNSMAEDGSPEAMVIVGCRRCFMYVMLSDSHPCCPKCGNTDQSLLARPVPLPKKQRTAALGSSSCK
ncbi:uncharacterized protein [Physcomitrium patens]|uniref:WW domain-containing protein n=1 Tax=Physcomitrium patens TaxID=3218 RepID=A0A2K1L0X5_PHYPA|nr:uncharacterized protein LOC112295979 [Physcomitrium patens]PNR59680.1 hypothetical protein PHYPA_002472 [Physcomitrium patens]|eukprot:XP_024403812.1 uncharacterized protein LOC112295979 [Physcomitrella patens]